MRVEFTGSPADVIRHMREFLAIIDPEPRASKWRSPTSAPPPPVAQELLPLGKAAQRAHEKFTREREETAAPPKPQPQTSAGVVCPFCGKSYDKDGKRFADHKQHCKANPDRTPHPKEGKPFPGRRSVETSSAEPTSSPSPELETPNDDAPNASEPEATDDEELGGWDDADASFDGTED